MKKVLLMVRGNSGESRRSTGSSLGVKSNKGEAGDICSRAGMDLKSELWADYLLPEGREKEES